MRRKLRRRCVAGCVTLPQLREVGAGRHVLCLAPVEGTCDAGDYRRRKDPSAAGKKVADPLSARRGSECCRLPEANNREQMVKGEDHGVEDLRAIRGGADRALGREDNRAECQQAYQPKAAARIGR